MRTRVNSFTGTLLSGGARIDVALLDEAAGTVRCRTTTSARNSETVTVHTSRNDSPGDRGNNADDALRTDLARNIDIAVHKALITLLPTR
ncbi:hypothetical protein [Nannocystis pusilla]|uniref:hypothetical protein n=1 Tax=Nannocystis pusilla TaxID=889268 RepID=UPI003B760D00